MKPAFHLNCCRNVRRQLGRCGARLCKTVVTNHYSWRCVFEPRSWPAPIRFRLIPEPCHKRGLAVVPDPSRDRLRCPEVSLVDARFQTVLLHFAIER